MKTMERNHPGTGTFIKVWIALLCLTVLTIYVAGLHLGLFSIFGALIIASIKAWLVLWFFMHLKYEEPLFRILFLVALTTFVIIVGFTFIDYAYR